SFQLQALGDRESRRRRQPPLDESCYVLVGRLLELLDALPMPAIGREAPPHVAYHSLHLALRLRLSRQARIDVEADTASVGTVMAVDDPPGASAPRHPGLEVVDANNGRDAFEPAKRLV